MRYLEYAAKNMRSIEWDGIRDVPMSGVRVHDLTDLPIPWIKDNTYDGVYSEHFIEHLTKEEGIALFEETFRILKPGGTVKTVWPSMDFVERLQSDEDMEQDQFVQHYYQFYIQKEHFQPKGFTAERKQDYCAAGLLHQKGEHKHLWYTTEMVETLKDLGYTKVKMMNYQDSRLSAFRGIDTPGAIRAAHSATVEAVKPWR